MEIVLFYLRLKPGQQKELDKNLTTFIKIKPNVIKSGISDGCFSAVASKAGVSIERVSTESDFGVDFHIKKLYDLNGSISAGPTILEVQLKCTQKCEINNNHIKYHLRVKNYNDIVNRNIHNTTRILLVLMTLHETEDYWCNVSEENIMFKNSLFWYEIDNDELLHSPPDSTKLIYIPMNQVLTSEQLFELVKKYDF